MGQAHPMSFLSESQHKIIMGVMYIHVLVDYTGVDVRGVRILGPS